MCIKGDGETIHKFEVLLAPATCQNPHPSSSTHS